jgi:hypothetical protein
MHLRIFLSSPGDVGDERRLARELIKNELPYDPFIRDKATLEIVSWDDPHAPAAMPAHLTPQEAINRGLGKPSDCDIVIVLFWKRMGTPLPPTYMKPNGERYHSGTEWEFEDAYQAAVGKDRPIILVYRREHQPATPSIQYDEVERFFERFANPDGTLKGLFHSYASPEQFINTLRHHLRETIKRFLYPPHDIAATVAVPAFQHTIERFISEYLISEEVPVPFGGRNEELARLDAWLDDNRAPSRFLITAPAGRGKSALLVRWIEWLKATGKIGENGWSLVFLPISIRFGLNAPEVYLKAFSERLAAIHGLEQRLENPPFDLARHYADKARELLQALAITRKHVLIVIDGLDEALGGEFDASIFPHALPPTIRIVASARLQAGDANAEGWIKRLEWDVGVRRAPPLELEPLKKTAIADVLVKMGAPFDLLAEDPALVGRLLDLTEGEPLLLRYYAEDLWRIGGKGARITLADLDTLRPGFGGYFDRWLDLQRKAWKEASELIDEREIELVLAYLAFAHGPLETRDLLELAARHDDRGLALSPHAMLRPLRRFVIGDGTASHGYVLSHPKIGLYLQGQRFEATAREIRKVFAEWGHDHVGRLNNAHLGPAQASRYALQFLGQHFKDTEAPVAAFMMFAEDGWRRAWEHFDGGQRGFSGDIRTAWDAMRRDDPLAHLAAQWRCALTLSSIKSLGYSIPGKVVIEAVKSGVLSVRQAQHFAELMTLDQESVSTFAQLAHFSYANKALCAEYTSAAVQRATSVHVEDKRFEALQTLIRTLFPTPAAFPPDIREAVIANLFHAALELREPPARARTIAAVGRYLPEDLMVKALSVANAIDDGFWRSLAIGGLAPFLPRELLAEVSTDGNKQYKPAKLDLPVIAYGYSKREELDSALAMAKDISDGRLSSEAIADLVRHLPQEQRQPVLAEALAAAESISDDRRRYEALAALAPHLPQNERKRALAEVLTAVTAIGDAEFRACTFTAIALHLPQESKRPALAEALTAAKAIADDWRRSKALVALAPQLPSELLADALAAAKTISDEQSRSSALTGLANRLPPELVAGALQAARAIRHDRNRVEALVGLATVLPRDQSQQILIEALAVTKVIGSEQSRSEALAALAPHLPENLLAEALAIAKVIYDADGRFAALAALAPCLIRRQRQGGIKNARATVNAIDDKRLRAKTLAAFASELPLEFKAEAVATAKSTGDKLLYCRVVAELGDNLPKEILLDALTVVEIMESDARRSGILAALAVHLPPEQRQLALTKALTAAEAIKLDQSRSEALALLAPHLPDEQRKTALAGALAAAKAIDNEQNRSQVLAALAPRLPPELLPEALTAGMAIHDDRPRSQVLAEIASHLPPYQQSDCMVALLGAVPKLRRDEALARLAAAVPAVGALAGTQALEDISRSISDVCKWYP